VKRVICNECQVIKRANEGNCLRLFSSSFSASAPVTWQHYALEVSQSGNFMRIYTNGVLKVSKTGMSPFVSAGYDLLMGGDAGHPYGGLLDEVTIYSRALSASEIQAIYNAGSAGKCTTP
jgi:hypothetical protein